MNMCNFSLHFLIKSSKFIFLNTLCISLCIAFKFIQLLFYANQFHINAHGFRAQKFGGIYLTYFFCQFHTCMFMPVYFYNYLISPKFMQITFYFIMYTVYLSLLSLTKSHITYLVWYLLHINFMELHERHSYLCTKFIVRNHRFSICYTVLL